MGFFDWVKENIPFWNEDRGLFTNKDGSTAVDGIKETGKDLVKPVKNLLPKGTREKKKYAKDGEKLKEQQNKPWWDSPLKASGMEIKQWQGILSWVILGFLIFLLLRD